jgi:hypothetical protein
MNEQHKKLILDHQSLLPSAFGYPFARAGVVVNDSLVVDLKKLPLLQINQVSFT